MHRAYRPVKPAQSKLLQRRWEDKYYEDHRRKVIEARPTVDSRPPQTYMHLHLKLKKLQLEEDRLYTIERDNRILLGKMSNIMKAKGTVDNRNSYESKSLNRDKRVRDLVRVGNENQQILNRITTRKPAYDRSKWEKDWETNQQYMDQISSYPKDWWKKSTDDYSDGTPRSSRRGGGGGKGGGRTNRSSRTYSSDSSRDSSPRQDKKTTTTKKKKTREEEEDEDDRDRSYSEDEDEVDRQLKKKSEDVKKKGKKWEEEVEKKGKKWDEEVEKKGKKWEEVEKKGKKWNEEVEKKGKKWEEVEKKGKKWDEEVEKEGRKILDKKDRYVEAGKEEWKRKGK